jgi:signal transduction histidine kinase
MKPLKIISSLRGRIFLASALLAVLAIGMAIYLVNVQVTREAERDLERDIRATGEVVDQLRSSRTQTFSLMARLIADLPKLKAAVETNDPPTVQDIARGYQAQLQANFVLVTNRKGEPLYSTGSLTTNDVEAHQPAIHQALSGRESQSLLPRPNGLLQVVTVPITIGLTRPEMLGALSVGFLLDDQFAGQLKAVTGNDVAFGIGGQIRASTRPRSEDPQLADALSFGGISRLRLGGEEFEALLRPLSPAVEANRGVAPVALIVRSRTQQLKSLDAIHAGLFVTAILAVLLATVLSFAVSSTIARPLAAITAAMREVTATGDLSKKIVLGRGPGWNDEDTQLLATTFNTLTESVERAQREIAHKERLSALGRLSTVIAHEIRNPLMIIKAALHTLRREDVNQMTLREAVADIDGEVVRLNRIVNEVLDFARPIRFELASADLNALVRESAAAAQAADSGPAIALSLDPSIATITTDPERLRVALVNILVNARHAVAKDAAHGGNGHGPLVELRTRSANKRAAIIVSDRGVGISPADAARIFDPYFTTKHGGTGLGLAIAKNIVEGLGGTITFASQPGQGTEFCLEFPHIP